MSEIKNLSLKSVFVLSYNVVGGIVGYISMFFALKYVGQQGWGILGAAIAISGLLAIITNLGTEQTHIKKLTEKNDFYECMGTIFILKSLLGVFFLVSAFLLIFIVGNIFGFKFESEYLLYATYIAILSNLLGSFSGIFRTTYQAKLKARRTILPQFAQLFIQNTLIIIFSIYFKLGVLQNPEFVGVLFVYSYLLGHFGKLSLYLFWAAKDRFHFKIPSISLVKEYLVFSIPLALSGMMVVIQGYTDRIMLQFFWNSAEVGGYFAVQKLSLFIYYLGASVSFFLYPAQSKSFEKKDNYFYEVTFKSERYLSMISVPFVFFTYAMAPELLNIYRASMVIYSIPFVILITQAYLNVINRPYETQITSANKPREILKVSFIQALFNVILNTLFIPKSILGIPLLGWKSTGAALGTFISFTMGFIYLRLRIRKILKITFRKNILHHIIAGVVSFLGIYALKLIGFSLRSWYAIAGSFILFLSIYLLILVILHEAGKEEFKFAISLLKQIKDSFLKHS